MAHQTNLPFELPHLSKALFFCADINWLISASGTTFLRFWYIWADGTLAQLGLVHYSADTKQTNKQVSKRNASKERCPSSLEPAPPSRRPRLWLLLFPTLVLVLFLFNLCLVVPCSTILRSLLPISSPVLSIRLPQPWPSRLISTSNTPTLRLPTLVSLPPSFALSGTERPRPSTQLRHSAFLMETIVPACSLHILVPSIETVLASYR